MLAISLYILRFFFADYDWYSILVNSVFNISFCNQLMININMHNMHKLIK